MASVEGFPYFEIEISKDGSIVDARQIEQIETFLTSSAGGGTTDVLVFSHGWDNDEAEARDLYARFLANIQSETSKNSVADPKKRNFAFIGVMWPSKKFADAALIPGGAAGINDGNVQSALELQHKQLADALPSGDADNIDEAAKLINQLETADGRAKWVARLRQAAKGQSDEPDGSNLFFSLSAEELFEKMKDPVLPPPPPARAGGGAGLNPMGSSGIAAGTGGAAGFGALIGGIKGAALRILNYTTFYIMKNRAGEVGRSGLKLALQQIQAACPPEVRFHLLGHSFGARVVTAATSGTPRLKVQTLTLLQAAYSHYGMATNYDGKGHDGMFRDIIAQERVAGPILISHSVHDLPVGIAYAIASRLAGQSGAAFGGPADPYGGLGRNGAQKTDKSQCMPLLPSGANYSFQSHVANNLNGDGVIQGHSDICRPEIARAFLAAVAAA